MLSLKGYESRKQEKAGLPEERETNAKRMRLKTLQYHTHTMFMFTFPGGTCETRDWVLTVGKIGCA